MNDIKRAFEHWMRSLSQWRKFPLNLMDGFEGGYEAGEIAMREKAAQCATESYWGKGDALDIARAIRALAISGAEESKKETP